MSPAMSSNPAMSNILGFLVVSFAICYPVAGKTLENNCAEPSNDEYGTCNAAQGSTMVQLNSASKLRKSSQDSQQPLATYAYSHTIANLPGYLIEWTIFPSNEIQLRLTAPAMGWIGFGFSESGGMVGADILAAWFDATTGNWSYGDYYSTQEAYPTPDTCNDWNLLSGAQTATNISVVVTRKLNTGDTQDWPIINATQSMRVIAAYGDSNVLSYHGVARRASTKIDFFNEASSPATQLAQFEADQNIMHFDILNDNSSVPSKRTTYYHVCVAVPVTTDHHLIAIRHILDDASKSYTVHHFNVQGFRTANCSGVSETIWGWAPGIEEEILPQEAGFLLGGTSGYTHIAIEMHIDNPNGTSGEVDNSGIRIYYTSQLRKYNMGIMGFADPLTAAEGIEIPPGWSTYSFSCPNVGCFSSNNGGNSVTVVSALHHMHASGRAMRTRLYNSNQELYKTLTTNWYDYDFQDYVRTEPFEFLPGTYAEVECVYETISGEKFGRGSDEEMCISSLTYYPAFPTDARFCGYVGSGTPTALVNFFATFSSSSFPGGVAAAQQLKKLAACSTETFANTTHGTSPPTLDWQTFSNSPGSCSTTP